MHETEKGAREKATLYLQHQKVFYYDGQQMVLEVPKVAAAVLAYASKVGKVMLCSRCSQRLTCVKPGNAGSHSFSRKFCPNIVGRSKV